jgi:hypothetical protein
MSRGRLKAIVPGSLAHIMDQSSERRFLIDTGASFSIMPYKYTLKPQGQRLAGPDGQLHSSELRHTQYEL